MKTWKQSWQIPADCLMVLLTVLGAVIMVTNRKDGVLVAYGWENLKFFTVDSNLLLGLAYLLELGSLAAQRMGRLRRPPLWIARLLYVATVAVALTFTVVVAFFGPAIGYGELFRGANLFFHLVIPVLAMAFFCIFHRDRYISWPETGAALIPSVLYGLYYTGCLLVSGVHFPETDWYGFAAGGVVGAIISATSIFLITWVLALLLRLISGSAKRKERAGALN